MKLSKSDKILGGIMFAFGFYVCYQIWAEKVCDFVLNLLNQII